MFQYLRCFFGIHSIRKNSAFYTMGAVFAGGFCTACGDFKQGKFLGNVWTEEIKHETHTELKGFDISFATEQGYTVKPLELLEHFNAIREK